MTTDVLKLVYNLWNIICACILWNKVLIEKNQNNQKTLTNTTTTRSHTPVFCEGLDFRRPSQTPSQTPSQRKSHTLYYRKKFTKYRENNKVLRYSSIILALLHYFIVQTNYTR